MLRIVSITILASLIASGAQACVPKRYFKDPAQYEIVCALENNMPFEVGSRRVWDDHIAFFDEPKFIDNDHRRTIGLVYDEQGKPFSSKAIAEKIAKKIARLQDSEVGAFKYSSGKPMELTLLCPYGDH